MGPVTAWTRAPWIHTLVACVMLLVTSSALGANRTLRDDYDTQLASSTAVQPLGADHFGETIDYYSGATSFLLTDVSLPGNNELEVSFQRALDASDDGMGGMFKWSRFEVPYLNGIFPLGSSSRTLNGWFSGARGMRGARCTDGMPPEVGQSAGKEDRFFPEEYWHGNHLHLPGKGSQLMQAPGTSMPLPQNGVKYSWATQERWLFSCLPSTKNGVEGEGFLGHAPDGKKYYFDWLIKGRHVDAITKSTFLGDPTVLSRDEWRMMVTRIEDRHGNWVNYQYSGTDLVGISSSDGRQLTISYASPDGAVSSVTDQQRVWRYDYSDGVRVAYPDGSTWSSRFTGPGITRQLLHCSGSNQDQRYLGEQTLVITAASGAVGTFQFRPLRRGVSYVPDSPLYSRSYCDQRPSLFDNIAIVSKRIDGPGLPPQVWNVTYGPPNQCYAGGSLAPCASTSPATRSVDVQSPTGFTRYVFGNTWHSNEGLLLEQYLGSSLSALLRAESYAWTTYPSLTAGMNGAGDRYLSSVERVLDGRTLKQESLFYVSATTERDVFRRPVVESISNTQGQTRSSRTLYEDNFSIWLLGQVRSKSVHGVEVSRVDYDPVKALPTRSYAFGKLQQTFTYNPDGTVETVRDGNNNVTLLWQWNRGVPQSIQHGDGGYESAFVDNAGRIVLRGDENRYTTSYSYDPMGRLTSVTLPPDDSVAWNRTTQVFEPVAVTEYGLSPGHWRKTVSTGTARKITYFDALWRPVLVREYDSTNMSGTQRLSTFRYDHEGRRTFASYPVASASTVDGVTQGTRTFYDALGRVTRVEQDSELGVLATTTSYLSNANGAYTLVTNARGQQTRTWYQMFDEPTYDRPTLITHPEGAVTEIARDIFGKPLSLVRTGSASPALVRNYVYDAYQQLCKTIEPETGATIMAYDGAGNLAWSAAGLSLPSTTTCDAAHGSVAARKVTRTYDARNRLKTMAFPDGLGNTSYTYAPDGLLAAVAVDNGGTNRVSTSYSYNKRRLMTGEQMAWGQILWRLTYGYDANGSLSSLTYPDGLAVSYLPNALGQPSQVGSYARGVSYYPNGAIRQFTYGNGIVHTLTQNARQLPDTSRDAYGATAFLVDGYDYDANGNVAAITDGATSRGQRGNRTMVYDGLDRLTGTASPMFGNASYAYDVYDNLTRVTVTGGNNARNHYYCYDLKWRLTNVKTGNCGGSTIIGLGYDVQGNLSNKNGAAYTFDYGNRLRAVSINKVPTASYVYDGHGRRVRDYTTASRYTLYSKDGQLLFASDARRNSREHYIHLGGSLVAIRERNNTTAAVAVKYQHTDALGSPVAVTDANRTIVERTEYEPYGHAANRPMRDGPGYTGHVEDARTGLVYAQQRYYDPMCGCFLSVDPVTAYDNGDWRHFNRYAYAYNNPYKFTDPDGRQAVPDQPLVFYQMTTRTTTDSGAVNVARTNVSNYGVVHGTRTEVRGTVTLLPQKSLGGTPANPGPAVTTKLLNFSDKSGQNIEVTSGQRTVEQNRTVGGASRSQHLQDNAADIRINGNTPKQTADAAHGSGEFNRVNQYTDGRGVHVDLKQDGTQGRFTDWKPKK